MTLFLLNLTLLASLIPINLNDWKSTKMSGKSYPKFEVLDSKLKISTQEDAGGLLYLFEGSAYETNGEVDLSWDWKVAQFPQNSDWSIITKANDDSPIRIGVLISDPKSKSIPVPKSLKLGLGRKSKKVSHIIFYSAIPGGNIGAQFQVSPYQEKILYCLLPASKTFMKQSVAPLNDFRKFFRANDKTNNSSVEIIGLWVFADSDNLKGSSQAYLKNLSFAGTSP